jgi:hypothetical protein
VGVDRHARGIRPLDTAHRLTPSIGDAARRRHSAKNPNFWWNLATLLDRFKPIHATPFGRKLFDNSTHHQSRDSAVAPGSSLVAQSSCAARDCKRRATTARLRATGGRVLSVGSLAHAAERAALLGVFPRRRSTSKFKKRKTPGVLHAATSTRLDKRRAKPAHLGAKLKGFDRRLWNPCVHAQNSKPFARSKQPLGAYNFCRQKSTLRQNDKALPTLNPIVDGCCEPAPFGTIVPVLTLSAAAATGPGRQLRRPAKLVMRRRCARLLRLRYVLAEARVSTPTPHSEGAPRANSVLKAERSAGRNTEASPRRLAS